MSEFQTEKENSQYILRVRREKSGEESKQYSFLPSPRAATSVATRIFVFPTRNSETKAT